MLRVLYSQESNANPMFQSVPLKVMHPGSPGDLHHFPAPEVARPVSGGSLQIALALGLQFPVLSGTTHLFKLLSFFSPVFWPGTLDRHKGDCPYTIKVLYKIKVVS